MTSTPHKCEGGTAAAVTELEAAIPERAAPLATLSTLEQAVMELPSTAVADIPVAERRTFLAHLREDIPGNKRLDTKNGFLEFYTDGHVPFRASSMLYMKVFRLADGGRMVLCHMPKPHADSHPPRLGQTFFFKQHDGQWIDVTGRFLPKGVDARWRFQPRRDSAVVEAGPYERTWRSDGRGYAYIGRRRMMDLVWEGTSFRTRKSKSSKYHNNSL